MNEYLNTEMPPETESINVYIIDERQQLASAVFPFESAYVRVIFYKAQ